MEISHPQRRLALLVTGTAALCLAVGGRWDVAAAAWVFPVLLLRFSRTGRAWTAALGVWLAHVAAALFWIFESRLGLTAVTIGGGAALALPQTAPFLLDRFLARGPRPWPATLVFPFAVAAAEFLITLLSPFGTAFGSLAVTQHANLSLLQVTSVTGSYGIGFLIAWAAVAANRFWEAPSRRSAQPGALYAAVLAAVVLAGAARIFLAPVPATVRIAAVSPSRQVTDAQRAVFDRLPDDGAGIGGAPPAVVDPVMTAVADDLLASTRREAAAGARIVVWPETAVKVRAAREHATIDAARAEARRDRIYLEIGIRVFDAAPSSEGRNETVLIDPDGKVLWTYQKAHPIPGSETYAPGDGHVPVVFTPYGRIANVICYDADFPAMMRVRADIMLVPSHDWREYGRAHTDKAALRAVENGYALVRPDSEGVSAAFDARGDVLASADYFTTGQQTLVADVPVRGRATLYTRVGDLFAWLCITAVAGLTLAEVMRLRRRSTKRPTGRSYGVASDAWTTTDA